MPNYCNFYVEWLSLLQQTEYLTELFEIRAGRRLQKLFMNHDIERLNIYGQMKARYLRVRSDEFIPQFCVILTNVYEQESDLFPSLKRSCKN
ncbi:CLUMA_CG016063, isoform A [Clunio marinus]|uniref:CLUMA_CG016063, isoform A n=1 Tax=Clunio marinus TaxID=568069 RepID=A0A1J1IRK9_9DIPT|nr:CLUMA_CG016063, isoform A [Clunio marinus]